MKRRLGGVVLLTGASSGIGRALARELRGVADVLILVARRKDRLESLRDELAGTHTRVEVRALDLTNLDAAVELTREVELQFGRIDILINNAGAGHTSLLEDADLARLEAIVALNVQVPLRLMHTVLPGMIARGSGVVLNVGSIASDFGVPAFGVYAGTKHFLAGITEAVSAEVASCGVLVSIAKPGFVDTEFAEHASVGAFAERRLPPLLNQRADACARAILSGIEKNRTVIGTGLRSECMRLIVSTLPSPVRRRLLEQVGRGMRRKS